MPGIGLGSIFHRRRKLPAPNVMGDPLGTGGGLTNTNYRLGHPDLSLSQDHNTYGDENTWPVSMSPSSSGGGGMNSIGTGGRVDTIPSALPNQIPMHDVTPGGNATPANVGGNIPPATHPAVPTPVQQPTPYSSVFGQPGMFHDENGNNTYSHDAKENNQYGYWGKDAFNPDISPFDRFGRGNGLAGIGGGGGGVGDRFNRLPGMYDIAL